MYLKYTMSAFKIRIWCQPKHMSKIRHLRLTSLVSTSCKLFKLFKYCFGTVEDYVMYNEDDAWGSPHRTINTLNTTGINCRFPKVNFLWSYFLLAFKWKYCSYNLYKLFYIVLNGTPNTWYKENLFIPYSLFLSSGQFMTLKFQLRLWSWSSLVNFGEVFLAKRE